MGAFLDSCGYRCPLEAQPDHLMPRWLVESAFPCVAPAELSLGEDLRQSEETLWVTDPATRVIHPFVLHPATWRSLHAWRFRGVLPSADLLRLLFAAGIATTGRAQCSRHDEWAQTVAVCRASLGEGFAAIRGLIHPFQLSALRRYYRRLMRHRQLRLGDAQCPRRYVANDEPMASFFHHQLCGAVSTLLGKPVKPSYSYFIGYQAGARLDKHVDRPQCEYTLALCLDFSPEPFRQTSWPLQLALPDRTVIVYQALGDALLYEGRRIPHFRSPLSPGCTSTSILFHYVDADFEGPLS